MMLGLTGNVQKKSKTKRKKVKEQFKDKKKIKRTFQESRKSQSAADKQKQKSKDYRSGMSSGSV